jgi:uncharacterized protein YuzE
MNVSFDPEADAAYIGLSLDAKVADTLECELPETSEGDINLDFDSKGHLVGIEILNASKVINGKLLESWRPDKGEHPA